MWKLSADGEWVSRFGYDGLREVKQVVELSYYEIDSGILPPSKQEQFSAIERTLEQHMDAVAQSDRWDNRWTCVARAGYANPWQAKGVKFAQWMDQCWTVAMQAQTDVIAGTRPMPTPAEAVAELPKFIW